VREGARADRGLLAHAAGGRAARKAVWNGIDRKGRRIIDQVFPQAIRKRTNATDMLIELKCGSIWQLVGSDNYNSLVGSNPVGIVHSEFSIANPSAREFLRPILRENGGWEMYIYTPRGKTHGWELHEMAKNNPAWFAELLTIEDTGLVGLDGIAEERAEGMSEDIIQQEYYCSFDAAVAGTYYGQLMSAAEKDGRVCRVPHDPKLRTETCGTSESMTR
jgi:phage terminase large subunit